MLSQSTSHLDVWCQTILTCFPQAYISLSVHAAVDYQGWALELESTMRTCKRPHSTPKSKVNKLVQAINRPTPLILSSILGPSPPSNSVQRPLLGPGRVGRMIIPNKGDTVCPMSTTQNLRWFVALGWWVHQATPSLLLLEDSSRALEAPLWAFLQPHCSPSVSLQPISPSLHNRIEVGRFSPSEGYDLATTVWRIAGRLLRLGVSWRHEEPSAISACLWYSGSLSLLSLHIIN